MSVFLATVLAVAAIAGPEPGNESKHGKVRCEIQIIHATRGKAFMDPSLKPVARFLKNSFGARFQAFKQLGRSSMTLSKSQRSAKKLPNDTELSLTYLGSDKQQLRLVMEVGGMKTVVKVHNGGLFFQAGRRYKSGMLIVAIRAHGLQ